MATNENAQSLDVGLTSKFWWLRKDKHLKFTEKYATCTKKHVLVEKIFTNGQNMDSPLYVWDEKTVHRVETNWLPGKERVPGALVSKESDAADFLGH